ncbi:unnamed protein product [Ambrosiozyma monospora]|uniref:Unnamed protein product n=1 Tax=Ambrosiozyma monospora TaxID=43982 RepID=A0A9W7DIX7_AMBMO|nr:unnamed protein product [Ambrosiozyma monospora]
MTGLVCFNISNLDPIQKILTKNLSQNNDPSSSSSLSEAISQSRKLETHEIIIKILLAILKNIFYLICAIKITSWFHHETDFELTESLLIIPDLGFQEECTVERITVIGLVTGLVYTGIKKLLQLINKVQIDAPNFNTNKKPKYRMFSCWITILEALSCGNITDASFDYSVSVIDDAGNINNSMNLRRCMDRTRIVEYELEMRPNTIPSSSSSSSASASACSCIPPKPKSKPLRVLFKIESLLVHLLFSKETIEKQFFPMECIKDLIIHEGFKEFGVEFYLALVVKDGSTSTNNGLGSTGSTTGINNSASNANNNNINVGNSDDNVGVGVGQRKENLKIVVLFDKLLPRRKLLETVWRRSRRYVE